jgi:ABC-type transport system involved in multi-copper enzyme maturation permease subunit
MTASISTSRPTAAAEPSTFGRFSGFRALARRELMEWRRARRSWIVFAVSALFLTLAALNSWLISVLPSDVTEGAEAPVLDPLMNLLSPVSTHVFVIVAIFAVIALISAERESGTLAWVASKPVSRSAIWMAKFATASGVMFVAAAALPLAATVALVTVLYGAVPVTTVVAVAIGMAMIIVLYVAIALAASTVAASQAAVAAITLAVLWFAPMLGAFLPDPTVMPWAILDWSVRLGAGEPVGIITPISWAVAVALLTAFSLQRMERMEL